MQQYEVEAIIAKRYVRNKSRSEYLVKWKKFPIQKSSWEPLSNLKNAYQLVKIFQIRNEKKKQISLVQVKGKGKKQNKTQIQDKYQKEDEQQQQKEKSRDNNQQIQALEKEIQLQYEKKKKKNQRSRQLARIAREKRQIQRRKQLQSQGQQPSEDDSDSQRIIITKMTIYNDKTYFRIMEANNKEAWRNRSYLVEFYPKQLCKFYEQQVLERHINNKNS